MTKATAVTRLLGRWRQGDESALETLMPLVYDELRRLARAAMRGEGPGHELQTTALVHEAYARLVGADVPFTDRVHFFSVAARMMRRILVDHARQEAAAKRGGGRAHRVTLTDALAGRDLPLVEFIDLDAALTRLAQQDERKSRAIELHYFAGLTSDEIATALDVAPATVRGDLRLARAWLRRELTENTSG
jgi:RNA polymerase sigma factor (TIGR02999 family)